MKQNYKNVPLEAIKIGERIRKDIGDIGSLYQDIKENGLISPPVVTQDLELIAGFRRLAAMRMLKMEEVPVIVMEVKDYEHMLNLEINENESRKDFTKMERIAYARQLEQIERMKAKERMGEGVENFPQLEEGKTRDIVAQKLGIGSGKQYEKEKYIADNADPETLTAWDQGDISTHAAYQQLKKAKEEAEQRASEAEKLARFSKLEAEGYQRELRAAKESKPEVIEKVVEKEVAPADYHQVKKQVVEVATKAAELEEKLKDANRIKQKLEKELEGHSDVKLEHLNRMRFKNCIRKAIKDLWNSVKEAESYRDDVEIEEIEKETRLLIVEMTGVTSLLVNWRPKGELIYAEFEESE